MERLRLLAIIEARNMTGPAKNLLEFATLARELDVDTSVATFIRGEESNEFIESVQRSGIAIDVFRERGPWDPAVVKSLAGFVSARRPHVIQTHAVKSHFLARTAGLPKRAPWIAFHHGYTWPALRTRVYNQLDRWSLTAAAKVLTVSEAFREELAAKGVPRERIEIMHNAIRPDWGTGGRSHHAEDGATGLRAELGIPPDRNIILIVGRLSREKDHLTLLRAVNRLRASLNLHLLVIGEGPERGPIEHQILQHGMTECVTLTGHQSSVEPYYRIANLAVLSSRSEGSPNTLLEALAAGVPVVATNVGGIPEIVTHEESALLVPPGDIDRMAAAMTKLLADPSLAKRFVERGRTLILKHSPEARAKRLAEIYRSVVDQGR